MANLSAVLNSSRFLIVALAFAPRAVPWRTAASSAERFFPHSACSTSDNVIHVIQLKRKALRVTRGPSRVRLERLASVSASSGISGRRRMSA
jgi:hypothetical protein